MPDTKITDLSLLELTERIKAGEISPVESLEASFARIEAFNPALNAFVHLCRDRALVEARSQEKRLAEGQPVGPLAGVPLGVKDLEDVAGLPTTFGSSAFRDHMAREDSVQVARLRAAGAIVVGKTNTPEFGYTGFTKNRLAVAFTYPFDFSGHPAASLRAGFTDSGLPAGLQVVGPRHRDDLVLRAAEAYDSQRPMDRWPDLAHLSRSGDECS